MPSPVAHTLIGLAVGMGCLVPRRRAVAVFRVLREKLRYLLVFLVIANFPDLDYVPGLFAGYINAFHFQYTHTLGWIAGVALAVWLLWRRQEKGIGWGMLAVLFGLLASHLAADMLMSDYWDPFGIMVLWPFSDRYFASPVTIFANVAKAEWPDIFKMQNLYVLAVELAWCVPLVLGVSLWKRTGPRES
jgi:membrane-bound metal-dependent hydrolase YbcI (DUF457 family)